MAGWRGRFALGVGALVLGAGAVLAGTGHLGRGAVGLGDLVTGRSSSSPRASRHATRTARPTPARTAEMEPIVTLVPRLTEPEAGLVRTPRVTVAGTLPDSVVGRRRFRIRIYVNGELVGTRKVPDSATFRVLAVPLSQGENRITVALKGPRGESPSSSPVVVTLDDVAPVVELDSPRDGAVVNAERVEIQGTTEPGSRLRIRNASRGGSVAAEADSSGAFRARLSLGPGTNTLVISAVDAAGNRSSSEVTVVKGEGEFRAEIRLSRTSVALDDLPVTLDIHVTVLDPDSRPVEGAEVVFSLSVPGIATSTYPATTGVGGVASWEDRVIPETGAIPADGLVTALVTLPGGKTVRATASFTIEER